MNLLISVSKKINRLMAEISGYLIAIIVVMLLVDTCGLLTGFHVPIMVELAVFVTIASGYLGLSYVEENRAHIKVDSILSRLPEGIHRLLNIVWKMLEFLIIGLTTYAAYIKAYESIVEGEEIAGEIALSLAPIRTIILISVLLYCFQLLINLILDIKKR